MLVLENLEAAYGHAQSLHGINLEVQEGEVVCLVGRNGAGKTSTLRAIVNDLIRTTRGHIHFKGEDITFLKSHLVIRKGIAYVPEDRRVFANLTIAENLIVPMSFSSSNNAYWTIEKVFELFPPLREFRSRLAGNLSGGQQQMLTIARSLLTNPQLLLLDEPHEGLAPLVTQDVVRAIEQLKSLGVSMLISEQQLHLVHDIADRIYVIDRGRIAFSGTTSDFLSDPSIAERYLMVM